MVTLITEKLQNQSLDDLTRKTREAGPYSAEKVTKSGCVFPLEVSAAQSPWKALPRARRAAGLPEGAPSGGRGEGAGAPAAPPTKRHCRSLSGPEELARGRSPWRPGGSGPWTAVCEPRLQGRPASASGAAGSAGDSEGRGRPRACPLSRRRLSLSQELLSRASTPAPESTPASTPASTPEPKSTPESAPAPLPGRRLPRCRSQPCVLAGRSRRKRRRDAGWTRPSLDLLKMTRTLKNSKSLCSLDYEDDEDTQAETVVSSPCGSQGRAGLATPGCSPRAPRPCPPSPWASEPPGSPGGGSSGDPSDWDSAGEEGVFPLDASELDLEQIENN